MKCASKYYSYLLLIFVSAATQKLNAQSNLAGQNNFINLPIEAKLSDLISDENIVPYLGYFKKDEIVSWQITVPVTHGASSPKGLLVFISPQDSGEIYEMWKPLLIEKNLIWIAANKGGNEFLTRRRVLQALLAVQLAAKNYQLDEQRIYLAGFSGGGRVASIMALLYPEIFAGSIFMGGATYLNPKLPEKFSLMNKKSYVFINGDKDFNYEDSKKVSEKFRKLGLNNVKFFEINGLSHHPPDAKTLGNAIDYIDANKSTN